MAFKKQMEYIYTVHMPFVHFWILKYLIRSSTLVLRDVSIDSLIRMVIVCVVRLEPQRSLNVQSEMICGLPLQLEEYSDISMICYFLMTPGHLALSTNT